MFEFDPTTLLNLGLKLDQMDRADNFNQADLKLRQEAGARDAERWAMEKERLAGLNPFLEGLDEGRLDIPSIDYLKQLWPQVSKILKTLPGTGSASLPGSSRLLQFGLNLNG